MTNIISHIGYHRLIQFSQAIVPTCRNHLDKTVFHLGKNNAHLKNICSRYIVHNLHAIHGLKLWKEIYQLWEVHNRRIAEPCCWCGSNVALLSLTSNVKLQLLLKDLGFTSLPSRVVQQIVFDICVLREIYACWRYLNRWVVLFVETSC